MRVLVIGAGVIGAAIAEALAGAGADVTVIEMRSPGRGASRASAGVLAPYTEAHGHDALLALGTRSLDLFDEFVAGVRHRSRRPIEYSRGGTVEVALTGAEARRLTEAAGWLRTIGVAHDLLDARALGEAQPQASPAATCGLRIAGQGFVGVSALVSALTQAARLAGARFETPVEAIDARPDTRDVIVRAGSRTYAADHLVVAAGSWSGRVRIAGVPALPVKPIRGQLLHLAWRGGSPPSAVVWGPRCYTVPWTDGSLLVGATVEDVGFDERTTAAGVETLIGAVSELLPAARDAAVEEIRVGLRPASPDGLPIVGRLPSAPNVHVATGHYRNGILLAPLTASVIATSILEGVDDPMVDVTTPARFATTQTRGRS